MADRIKTKKRERRHELGRSIRVNKAYYLMMLPFMALFFYFSVLPVISSIVLGFTSFNMLQWPHWVGLDNYLRLFLDDNEFIICVKNTLIFALITGPISYFACLFFAWLINEMKPVVRTIMTFLFFVPSISGNVFFIWTYIFSSDSHGILNGTLMKLGVLNEPINWLTDPKYSLAIIMLVQLWLSLGAGFLAFIAGLKGIDRSLYEAGAVDGIRNRWQEFIYITLPSMGPQLLFGAVIQISASFAAGSVSVALAGLPSTDYAADTIITLIMDYSNLRFEMGYASAIATVLFIAMIVMNQLIRKILSRYL